MTFFACFFISNFVDLCSSTCLILPFLPFARPSTIVKRCERMRRCTRPVSWSTSRKSYQRYQKTYCSVCFQNHNWGFPVSNHLVLRIYRSELCRTSLEISSSIIRYHSEEEWMTEKRRTISESSRLWGWSLCLSWSKGLWVSEGSQRGSRSRWVTPARFWLLNCTTF